MMMGAKAEAVLSVPCGSTCALVGIDNHLAKSGTVTSREDSFPLVNMKYSVSPVVRAAVSPKDHVDLPKLVEGLKRLSKSDQLVQVIIEPTGEHIIAAAGDLHLEICLNDLRDFMHGAEIVVSEPIVPFMETVTGTSSVLCMSKSPNHHNRLQAKADPIGDELTLALENGELTSNQDIKVRGKILKEKFNWDDNEARKIWAFGPEANPLNIVVDGTKGIQYMNEIRDHVVTGFQMNTKKGVLAEEVLRGAKFTILDAHLHPDTIHRGAGQIIPATNRVFSAAQLTAKPRLYEPVFLVDIQCPQTVLSTIYNVLSQKRGSVIEATQRGSTPLYSIKGYLPVTESFGFTEYLRAQTSGQAFPQCVFDHWELVNEDPLVDGRARDVVLAIRKRKGLEPTIPPLDRFLDKL